MKYNESNKMKRCGKYQSSMERALYSELSDEKYSEFNSHLSECPECRAEFNKLKKTLELVNLRQREEIDNEFIEEFWEELEPKLTDKESRHTNWWNNLKSFFQFETRLPYRLAGGFAILLLGMIIGKFLLTEDGPPAIIEKGEVNNTQVIHARAERYLDRSKVLLLGLINYDPADKEYETINLSRQQKISNELITEAADLKNNLSGQSNKQLQRLVSEVEIILMQIANLEIENDISGIELIKDGVDKRGIFLKINIQELLNQKVSAEPDGNSQNNVDEKKS